MSPHFRQELVFLFICTIAFAGVVVILWPLL